MSNASPGSVPPDGATADQELQSWIDGNVPFTLQPTLRRLVKARWDALRAENAELRAKVEQYESWALAKRIVSRAVPTPTAPDRD